MKRAVVLMFVWLLALSLLPVNQVYSGESPYQKERVPWIELPREAFVHGTTGIYYMTGGLGASDYEHFLKAIEVFRERFRVKTIRLILNSPGGDASTGFAIADTMLEAQAQGMTFEVRAYGMVASAAVMIFTAGTIGKRYLSPLAVIFLHEFSLMKFLDISNTTKQRREAEYLEMREKIYRGIIASRSKLTDDQLQDMMRKETWLSPAEAIELGLADGLTR